jgi:hypothetical protein
VVLGSQWFSVLVSGFWFLVSGVLVSGVLVSGFWFLVFVRATGCTQPRTEN